MKQLIYAIQSEQLKLKRTLVLRLAFIAPMAIVGLQFFITHQNGLVYMDDGQSPWFYFTRQTLQFWSLLMAPLFITLETALVAQLDHKHQCWKQLFALPISRWAIFVAKNVASLVLLAISTLSLLIGTLLSGWILTFLRPELGFNAAIPWLDLLTIVSIAYVGSFLIIVLHTWVALYWPNFAVAVGFGIVMTVAGILVVNSDIGPFYPWALSALAMNTFVDGQTTIEPLLVSILGSVFVFLIGGWLFLQKDVL